jgi:hypothetical protein
MGLFDKFKKKTEPEPIIDEKKLEQVARYQAKDHQVITDLQVKPLGKTNTYIEGKVFCKPWDTEIDVDMYGDVEIEYAQKCAEAMNSMPDELMNAICRAAKKYCIEFLDDIGGAELNEIEMTIPVDEDTPPREMLKCFEVGTLAVETPEDPSRIGYQLSGNCDWEEEHGIEIDILDDKLVYLGEYTGESPWTDHSQESWNSAAHIYE